MPNDTELSAERTRANSARAANLAKGREKLAEKRKGSEKSAEKTSDSAEKPKPSLSEKVLLEGSKAFVQFTWQLSGLVAWIIGGQLEKLSKEDIQAGAEEALPMLRRFPPLALALQFIGFPLWLCRSIPEKFSFKPKDEKAEKSAETKPAEATPPASSSGATVTPIHGARNGPAPG